MKEEAIARSAILTSSSLLLTLISRFHLDNLQTVCLSVAPTRTDRAMPLSASLDVRLLDDPLDPTVGPQAFGKTFSRSVSWFPLANSVCSCPKDGAWTGNPGDWWSNLLSTPDILLPEMYLNGQATIGNRSLRQSGHVHQSLHTRRLQRGSERLPSAST